MILRICCALIVNLPAALIGSTPPITSDLVYGGGSIQLTSSLDAYDTLTSKTPVTGTVMVTYPSTAKIDRTSFRMGANPLPVTFVSTSKISPYDDIMVAIYNFKLDPLPEGTHTLPSITVKVDGKDYAALPLVVIVGK